MRIAAVTSGEPRLIRGLRAWISRQISHAPVAMTSGSWTPLSRDQSWDASELNAGNAKRAKPTMIGQCGSRSRVVSRTRLTDASIISVGVEYGTDQGDSVAGHLPRKFGQIVRVCLVLASDENGVAGNRRDPLRICILISRRGVDD